VLAGGTGFIGDSLTSRLLTRDSEVIILTRAASHGDSSRARFVQWDGKTVGDWAQFIDGAAAVINLTGRSINCRHTPNNRREILESRLNSVRVLGQAIARVARSPEVFIQ